MILQGIMTGREHIEGAAETGPDIAHTLKPAEALALKRIELGEIAVFVPGKGFQKEIIFTGHESAAFQDDREIIAHEWKRHKHDPARGRQKEVRHADHNRMHDTA